MFNADEDEDFGAPLHLCDQTEMSASENLWAESCNLCIFRACSLFSADSI